MANEALSLSWVKTKQSKGVKKTRHNAYPANCLSQDPDKEAIRFIKAINQSLDVSGLYRISQVRRSCEVLKCETDKAGVIRGNRLKKAQ